MDPSVAVVLKEAALKVASILFDFWLRKHVIKDDVSETVVD